MSKILLYVDEDAIDGDFIEALKARYVNVLTVADVGMLHKSDEEQLDWATANGRVLFSFNTGDLYRLHTLRLQQSGSHSGIVLALQQRYSIGELMRGVLKLIEARSAEEMIGKVEFLSSWVARR